MNEAANLIQCLLGEPEDMNNITTLPENRTIKPKTRIATCRPELVWTIG
jgi:hypothetical protein